MLRQVITTRDTHFKKLQKRNEIWQSLPLPPANSRTLPTFITEKLLREAISMCRSNIKNDPIMYLPMHNVERSRIIRWRMGWLPGRPTTYTPTTTSTNNYHITDQLHTESSISVWDGDK
ncbi:hypothetical protein INT47_007110, partial [Mucor saturninus]